MNVWAMFSVMWRRWYIFLPLVAASVAVALLIPKASPPAFTVESTVMVQAPTAQLEQVPGSTTVTTVPVNPLLVGSANLAPVAGLLARVMNSSASATALRDINFDGTYTVVAPDLRQSLLTIDTVSDNRSAAVAANHKLYEMLATEIDRRQSSVINKPTEKVTVAYVVNDEIRVGITSKLRAAAVLLLAGVLITLAVTVFADSMLSRRSRRSGVRRHGASAVPEVGVHS